MITVDYLQKATGSTPANAAKYIDALNAAMDQFEINTANRISAFLATVSIESARLSAVEEGLFYSSPERLASIFKRAFRDADDATPFAKNPKALSQKLYQGFHGRGLIQLTWEANYRRCGEALGVDFVSEPNLLTTPEYAALSAAWFWKANGCNPPADLGDMTKVTAIVNGPAKLHLAERKAQYLVAKGAFSDADDINGATA
jgi:putative chitinase